MFKRLLTHLASLARTPESRAPRIGSVAMVAIPIAVISLASSDASAVIRRVDPGSPTNGDGSSTDWSNAAHSLSAVLSVAGSGDEIWVASHIAPYKPANQSSSFDWEDNVKMLGGFAGYGASNPDDRNLDPVTNSCVLSGDINGDDGANFANYSDNCYHVITGETLSNSAVLEAFTIRGGNATGGGLGNSGGGMFLTASRPVIRNCRFIENRADQSGGGIFFKFSGSGSQVAIIRDCVFANNHADVDGGGIYLIPPANIVSSRFEGNSADTGGGLVDGHSSVDVNVYNCEFLSNEGGAMYYVGIGDATLRVVNTLMALNEAGSGAAILVSEGHLEVVDSTLADNTAESDAGAIYFSSGADSAIINNSILWGNSSPDDDEIHLETGVSLTVTYSDIAGGSVWTGTGNINGDPDFVGGGDYSLVCGSPCINAGDDDTIALDRVDLDLDTVTTGETVPFDLALLARIIGADVDGDEVDMGAYEKPFEPCLADITGDGNVDVNDLLAVVTHWGTCGAPCPYDIAPGGPCSLGADGVVDVLDMQAVTSSWGQCSESFFGGGGGSGNETSEAVLDCMAQAEASNLTGSAYIEFMWECLCAKGVFDCD